MEALGACFAIFGVSTPVVRLFALVWPLFAHAAILRETRTDSLVQRLCTSGFFLALFYSWQGNSIWPSVVISALAIPIAWSLGRHRPRAAGLWIGLAIAIKQTTAILLALVIVRLAFQRRFRELLSVTIWAAVPYAAAAAAFEVAGSGWDFAHWTLLVPFQDLYGSINLAPSPFMLRTFVVAFLPITIQAVLERADEYEVSTRWYLLVAVGLLLLAYPRFGLLEAIACVPCLAIGAARLLRRPGPRFRLAALAFVITISVTTGVLLFSSDQMDGKVLFWNDEPALNALVARLRRFPPDTPLDADLWPNILPQSGLLPPGRIYAHPWLTYLGRIDSVQDRMRRAAMLPGTVTVRLSGDSTEGEIVGPYRIEKR